MKVISPVMLGSIGGLQIVCHVLADRDGEHQRHTYPERSVQIWIRSYVRYEIVIATMRYHGSFEPLQHIVRIDIKELLIVLDCPEIGLGGT